MCVCCAEHHTHTNIHRQRCNNSRAVCGSVKAPGVLVCVNYRCRGNSGVSITHTPSAFACVPLSVADNTNSKQPSHIHRLTHGPLIIQEAPENALAYLLTHSSALSLFFSPRTHVSHSMTVISSLIVSHFFLWFSIHSVFFFLSWLYLKYILD